MRRHRRPRPTTRAALVARPTFVREQWTPTSDPSSAGRPPRLASPSGRGRVRTTKRTGRYPFGTRTGPGLQPGAGGRTRGGTAAHPQDDAGRHRLPRAVARPHVGGRRMDAGGGGGQLSESGEGSTVRGGGARPSESGCPAARGTPRALRLPPPAPPAPPASLLAPDGFRLAAAAELAAGCCSESVQVARRGLTRASAQAGRLLAHGDVAPSRARSAADIMLMTTTLTCHGCRAGLPAGAARRREPAGRLHVRSRRRGSEVRGRGGGRRARSFKFKFPGPLLGSDDLRARPARRRSQGDVLDRRPRAGPRPSLRPEGSESLSTARLAGAATQAGTPSESESASQQPECKSSISTTQAASNNLNLNLPVNNSLAQAGRLTHWQWPPRRRP